MFFLFNSNAACDSQKLTMTVSHVPWGMNKCVYMYMKAGGVAQCMGAYCRLSVLTKGSRHECIITVIKWNDLK